MASEQLFRIAMFGAREWPPYCDQCHANGVNRPAAGLVFADRRKRPTELLCEGHYSGAVGRAFHAHIDLREILNAQPNWLDHYGQKNWLLHQDYVALEALIKEYQKRRAARGA